MIRLFPKRLGGNTHRDARKPAVIFVSETISEALHNFYILEGVLT